MSKSISIIVLLICNLIIMGPFTNINFFSNAMPIGNYQYMNNGVSDRYSSYTYNYYRAFLGSQPHQSIFDGYGCNYNDDIYSKYMTKDVKLLHQTGQTQSFFEQTVPYCAKEVVQSTQSSVGEKDAGYADQQFVSNLTEGAKSNTYFVWVDAGGNFDILFRANSTSPTKNLSDNIGRSDFPQISSSSDGNNVYVAWQDNTPGNTDIFFAASTDSGQTFSTPKNISTNAGESTLPQMSSSSDGNNVYVAWQDNTPGNTDIFFATSTDSGQTFSTPVNLSTNAGESTFPQMSSSSEGNNVYVAWRDNTPGNGEIFFATSTDSGQTFSTTKNLSANAESSLQPEISSSSDGNNVYVVWQDFTPGTPGNFDIFLAASTDSGQTFSAPVNLSANPSRSELPQISSSSDGNNIYVAWRDNTPGNFDIFLAASTDSGQTFSTPINLSMNTGISSATQISSSGNNVYVVWQDNTPGNTDIFFAASTDNGQTFSTAKNLSDNPVMSESPQISSSSDGNNVYVVWKDNDIFFVTSTDNGQTFSTSQKLSANAGLSRSPQISSSLIFTDHVQTFSTPINISATPRASVLPEISSSSDGNNVYVVWQDNTPGNNDIFFAASTDNGQTFSPPKNLSNNPGASGQPEISSSGNNVYVVWQDEGDIFLAASTDSGQTFSPPKDLRDFEGGAGFLQISSSGNNVYVVWIHTSLIEAIRFDIYFAASTDNGQTFSPPKPLGPTRGFVPALSSSGNNVYVVWSNITPGPGNSDVFFAASTDNGNTFSTTKNLSTNPGSSLEPQISSSGNNVYVAWRENTPGNTDIFFMRSVDNGRTFSTTKNLSTNPGSSLGPQISPSSQGNNVYVLWTDNTPGNNDIFFAASTDSGQTFSTPKNISTNAGESIFPQISSSSQGNNVYVVWRDNTPGPGNSDIFFAASTDSGETFSQPKNLSNDPRDSSGPEISSPGNNVYVVWSNLLQPLNEDVFFVRNLH